jgi:hypothetical protein
MLWEFWLTANSIEAGILFNRLLLHAVSDRCNVWRLPNDRRWLTSSRSIKFSKSAISQHKTCIVEPMLKEYVRHSRLGRLLSTDVATRLLRGERTRAKLCWLFTCQMHRLCLIVVQPVDARMHNCIKPIDLSTNSQQLDCSRFESEGIFSFRFAERRHLQLYEIQTMYTICSHSFLWEGSWS